MMELKAKHPKMVLNTKHPQMEMRTPVKRVGIEQIPADWEQTDETAVDYIKNKPTALSQFDNDMGYIVENDPDTVIQIVTKQNNEYEVQATWEQIYSRYSSNKKMVFCWELVNTKYMFDLVSLFPSSRQITLKSNSFTTAEWVLVADADNDNTFLSGTLTMEDTQPDWIEELSYKASYIKNKPTHISYFDNDMGYLTSADIDWNSEIIYLIYDQSSEKYTIPYSLMALVGGIRSNQTIYFLLPQTENSFINMIITSADLSTGKVVLTQVYNNQLYTMELIENAETNELEGELVISPIGGGQEEKVDYNLSFDRMFSFSGMYVIDNPKEDEAEMIADIGNGKANFIRALDLTYDPLDTLPKDGTILPNYEYAGDFITNNAGTGHVAIYRRIVAFTTAQNQEYIDNICVWYNSSTNKIVRIQHNYIQMFDAIIICSDTAMDNYPHAVNLTSSGGLWGKNNLVLVKTGRAGYASQFNFKLRVLTHGDNVWLSPVETIRQNALPRFIGESEKLGKRIIVTFDDFTDTGHPTGTIDMEDLPHANLQIPAYSSTDEGKVLKIVSGVPTWVNEG